MRAALVAVCLIRAAAAQDPETGAVALAQACLDATTDALVLNVAAHPDDEADRTLVWLRHQLGVRTVTAYSTYGEGGQNAVGTEIGPALAAIRVLETHAAAAHTGVTVRWLGFPDFGYSKSAEETLAVWGEAELRARMTALVDELDPDAVITNHTPDGGHGHHRATSVGIRAVAQARAEAGRPLPVYQRAARWQRPDFECDANAYDAVRGSTFARQASEGRHEHRTQGPWSPHDPTRGGLERWRLALPRDLEPRALTAHFGSVLEEPAFAAAWRAQGGDLEALRRALAAFGDPRTPVEHVASARALLSQLRAAAAALSGDEAGRRASRRLARRIDALQRVVLAGTGVDLEVWLAGDAVRILVHAADAARVGPLAVECLGARGGAADPARVGVVTVKLDPKAAPARVGYQPVWIDVDLHLVVDGVPVSLARRLARDEPPADADPEPRVPLPADPAVDPSASVALVRGPDDTLQRACEDLGVHFELLDAAGLAQQDLQRFAVLVLDIRAYYHRPELANQVERLRAYVDGGGRVLSFYHKSGEWNARPGRPLLAPFALEVGEERVCEEVAPVTLLHPEHELLCLPHAITKADFAGWSQERALNLPRRYDPRWLPLLEMHDAGDAEQRGALLVARSGKGEFVYCALALYRQLRAGHRGAARLLVNLLTPPAPARETRANGTT